MLHGSIETEELIIELVFVNGFQIYVKLELLEIGKVGSVNQHAWKLIYGLEEESAHF